MTGTAFEPKYPQIAADVERVSAGQTVAEVPFTVLS